MISLPFKSRHYYKSHLKQPKELGVTMKNVKKLRIMVIYGGKSGEHEVSLRSAVSVIRYLDRDRFDVIPVGIDKKGVWRIGDFGQIERIMTDKSIESLTINENAPVVITGDFTSLAIDVVFPVMHGPLCEDGSIQGLFELAEIPFVGSGVLGSAAGMDKEVSKRLVRDGGLPIVPFIVLKRNKWEHGAQEILKQTAAELGYPVFVKPANQGSSVGVHKVKDPSGLKSAVDDAFRYDSKILIEKAINAREIEFAVLESRKFGDPAMVSLPGEIAPAHEFYSYEAKYLDHEGAKLMIPAPLDPQQIALGQKIAREAFDLIQCESMARLDLFLDKDTGDFYFNEVNTLPGFTSVSMFPKLWENSGIAYGDLLSRLIDLAVARHKRKQDFVREYHEG
jgi:D-alanine-D-alanine ligase